VQRGGTASTESKNSEKYECFAFKLRTTPGTKIRGSDNYFISIILPKNTRELFPHRFAIPGHSSQGCLEVV
jgi:hypothetical protein